LRVERSPL